jgi:precorrin-2 dehydrogenase/sirohydrochlorin ferrochelatase
VVGAGDVALSRVDHLLVADAKVTVVTGNDIHPVLLKYEELGLLESLIRRDFKLSDLKMYEPKDIRNEINSIDDDNDDDDNVDNDDNNNSSEIAPLSEENVKLIEEFEQCKFKMVLTCVNNYPLSLRIWQQCKKLGLDVNLADKPAYCDFYFGSVYRQGPLQIMISTNGKSPRLCNRIKNKLLVPMFENLNLEKAVENLGYLRSQLRNVYHPGEETSVIKERMDWNKKITDFYTIQEWCEMNKDLIDEIVKLYPELPTLGVDRLKIS